MVIPSSDKNVRSLFALRELKAKEKLSKISLTNSIFATDIFNVNYFWFGPAGNKFKPPSGDFSPAPAKLKPE